MKKTLCIIISFVIPVFFLFPRGVGNGHYLHYVYILICAFILYFSRHKLIKNRALKFYVSLLLLDIFANSFSFIVGEIPLSLWIARETPLVIATCMAFIISNFDEGNLRVLRSVIYVTFILALFLVILDGTIKPNWIYELFYVKDSKDIELIDSIFHRAVGSFVTPYMAGIFCATLVLFSICNILFVRKIIYNVLLFVFGSIGLILTASRTSMLALFLAILFLLFFYKVKNKRNILILSVVCLLLVVTSDLSFLNDIIENLMNRNAQLEEGIFKGTGRLAAFNSVIENKLDFRCLFWGIGLAKYSIVEGTGFSLAHNGFLSIIIPFGLLGLILHLHMYFFYIMQYRKKKDRFSLFISLWIIFLLGTFFSADSPVSAMCLTLQAILLSCYDSKIVNS